jgi:uncharacterized protein (DUF1499 family)
MGTKMAYQESLIIVRPRGFAAIAVAGPALAVVALVGMAMVPGGWRLGLWRYGVSLRIFEYSAYVAAAGFVVSLMALAGWTQLSYAQRAAAAAGLVLAACLVYWPWHYTRLAAETPPIHDITTDTANPPDFWAVLPSRIEENALPVEYGGPAVARLQHEYYPDIKPVITDLSPRTAFAVALLVAQSMPDWIDVIAEPSSWRIEASQQSFWMHLTDDVSIRVAPYGKGSRIDVRSLSRQGIGDFGVNAARVRSYLGALKAALVGR